MESKSAEQPAEPVVWERQHRSARGGAIRFRAVRRLPGVYACESSTRKDATGNHVWLPASSGASDIVQALLADHLALQEATPPPTIPKPPSALSAFVAWNPGLTTDELLRRIPPYYTTYVGLHTALHDDPQISLQGAGATEKKRGWYAVFGKPEAKAVPAEETSVVTDDRLAGLVRLYRGKTTDELYCIFGPSLGWSSCDLHTRLLANPYVHGGPTTPKRWHPVKVEPEPAEQSEDDEQEFVGQTLEELVQENPGFTTEQLRNLLPSPDLCALVELAEDLAAIPSVYAVKKPSECVSRWFSKERAEQPEDDALVKLVRKHPGCTARYLDSLDTVKRYTEFVRCLKDHPGIHRDTSTGILATYRLAEPTA